MKRTLFLLCVLFFCSTSAVLAENFIFRSYYPDPIGIYSQIRLVPSSSAPVCQPGIIYLKKDSLAPEICLSDGSTFYWSYLDAIWSQIHTASPHQHYIFVTDLSYTDGTRWHIGSAFSDSSIPIANIPQLTIDDFTSFTGQDGGIIAVGTFGAGTALPAPSTYGANSLFIWYPRKSAIRAGYVGDGSNWTDANIGNYSVGFGNEPLASGVDSTVSGGAGNTATSNFGAIGGGLKNDVSALGGAIAGGFKDTVAGNYSFIGGGSTLTVNGSYDVIISGYVNTIQSSFSAIGGGRENTIDTISGSHHVILGGFQNNILVSSPLANAIGGGYGNNITGSLSFIGGGSSHNIYGTHNAIGGGSGNSIGSTGTPVTHSGIGGGSRNSIQANHSFIAGGLSNQITNNYSTIIGGGNNTASGLHSFVGGGSGNTASGTDSAVIGGENNTASGLYSFVGGGSGNTASGDYSTIAGGQSNTAAGDYSWAGGKNMNLTAAADRTFVWGISDNPFSITDDNSFLIFPDINVAGCRVSIGSTSPAANTKVLIRGQGAGTAALKIAGSLIVGFPVSFSPNQTQVYSNAAGVIGKLDLAETFEAGEPVSPGDVVVINEANKTTKKSSIPYDKKVLGVVSENPAVLLKGPVTQFAPPAQEGSGTKPAVALAGRVKCKVTLENGPIEYGDLLTTSSRPGYAMKATDPEKSFGAVIGKALEDFAESPSGNEKDAGLITILVSLQ